jgi:hexokinase
MNIEELFYKIGMHPSETDIAALTDSFLDEMRKGLSDEPSSLPMMPTYFSADTMPDEGGPVVSIDAGGTNLRMASVTFKQGVPVLEKLEIMSMPGIYEEISAMEFFDILAEKILPLCHDSRHIGLSFSYPAEIFENHDGRLLNLNKELKIKDAEGLVIGETLKKTLADKGLGKDMSFTLLNDTTAGFLGAAADGKAQNSLAGLVVGTGLNCCYIERGENIKKLQNPRDMIINCEAGMFNKLSRSEVDFLVDKESEIPGDHLLEKMVSGAYLGRIVCHTARLAAHEGILTPAFAEDYKPFDTKELDDYLRGAHNRVWGMCRGRDEIALQYIIDRTFERSAKLVCAVIAALCLHCDGGKDSKNPFYIAAEGSVFNGSLLFRKKLEKHVDNHIYMNLSRYVSFYNQENATLIGAAAAALSK